MKKFTISLLLVLLPFIGAEAAEKKAYEIPRTEVVPIQDSERARSYELYIRLPEDYSSDSDKKYPVIYTTDAVWHFEMLSGATEYLMPDVILVGISWQKDLDPEAEFVSRFRDYTITELSNPEHQARYQAGQARDHLRFIRNDVIRYVGANYRANAGERVYFGYSLGGQFGAYALLAEPDTFKHYILGSPAFGQRSVEHIDELEAGAASRREELSANVFVSIGELEESEMETTEEFMSVLQRRGQAGLAVTGLEIIEDSDHGTAFPETVIRSIKWLSSELKSADLRAERSITVSGEEADWLAWNGPEGNLTSLGNGLFDDGAFGLEQDVVAAVGLGLLRDRRGRRAARDHLLGWRVGLPGGARCVDRRRAVALPDLRDL